MHFLLPPAGGGGGGFSRACTRILHPVSGTISLFLCFQSKRGVGAGMDIIEEMLNSPEGKKARQAYCAGGCTCSFGVPLTPPPPPPPSFAPVLPSLLQAHLITVHLHLIHFPMVDWIIWEALTCLPA